MKYFYDTNYFGRKSYKKYYVKLIIDIERLYYWAAEQVCCLVFIQELS